MQSWIYKYKNLHVFWNFHFQLCHQGSLSKYEYTFIFYGQLVQQSTFRFLKETVVIKLLSKSSVKKIKYQKFVKRDYTNFRDILPSFWIFEFWIRRFIILFAFRRYLIALWWWIRVLPSLQSNLSSQYLVSS